ncbi:DDB1- and CUL4-associated factor 6 isoform X1 [Diabrotica virgifera virgifera]|uniref:DDB1- and CUL4-associated factor 6-like isoform X1 n=1 Tax=Diabrotica virgifera virgifera TaxID=50390 RepID=A0A6P7FSA4_DIAVI|nr:DDB1- and CUL4-associated factor 6 isoform X1 [Diabrotica virgifera virgifera]
MYSKRNSVFRDIYNRQYDYKLSTLFRSTKDDENFVQRLGLIKKLQIHMGCVNTICWNDSGEYLLSGSDDQHLVITHGHKYNVVADYYTSHHANIFSAKFLPCTNDRQIISCSGDGLIIHTDLNRAQESSDAQFNCHAGTTTYEVITVPNEPYSFLSCGEDGSVRYFDLRVKSSCHKARCRDDILISCQRAVTALALSPISSDHLAIGCADSSVRVYDRRYLRRGDQLLAQPFCTFVAPHFENERHYRITSLSYSRDGQDMLVSYSSNYLYLFNVLNNSAVQLRKPIKKPSPWDKIKAVTGKRERISSPIPVRRLRLRGDWSDTGPDARPERDNSSSSASIGQARPQLQATLMQRMTDVLSRMLNDPMTRAALSAGGEDSVDADENAPRHLESRNQNAEEGSSMETDQEQSSSDRPPAQDCQPNPDGPRAGITSHLHTHLIALRDLREGFINQHGAEPSVSFRYSQQSTSNSTISLRVNNRSFFEENPPTASTVPSTSERGRRDRTERREETNAEVDLDYEDEEEAVPDALGGGGGKVNEEEDDKQHVFEAEMKMKYMGHRNSRTMIKEATFWGDDYVMSGSDCGHVFIWNRHTAELKMLLQADQHVVNCLQPHPTLPLLATSGIDHDVKLWAPILEESSFDERVASELINRNAIMLEETRDTITVPASFMIRMLACLNQIRRGARNRTTTRRTEGEPEES